MTMYSDPEHPVWFQKKKVDEVLFCEELLEELPMICIHDSFFTVDGKVTDEGRRSIPTASTWPTAPFTWTVILRKPNPFA